MIAMSRLAHLPTQHSMARPVWAMVFALLVVVASCGSDGGGSSTGGDPSAGGTSGGTAGADAGGAAGDSTSGSDDDDDGGGGPLPACGDGTRDAGEACDDGNLEDGDGCSQSCTSETACGDGERQGSEACDDGNDADGDGCDRFCQLEVIEASCGDGVIDDSEECDDAGLLSGDGCDDRCRLEECGNDRIDAGEECDPPVANDCADTCLEISPNCGDGTVQEDEFEQCDDGNDEASDGCHQCRITCGNERVEQVLGEDCEPVHSPHTCSDACRWLPICGDGLIEEAAGEECDPANGTTCVACKVVQPPDCDEPGAAGAGGTDECPPDDECVPLGAGELIANGNFDAGLTGWAAHSTFVTLAAISEGVVDPDALELSFGTTEKRSVSGAFQCLPIEPGANYELETQYLIPEDSPEGVIANATVLLYAGDRCEGEWVPPAHNSPSGSARGTWTPYNYLIDTSTLLGESSAETARMLLRLNVNQPANVSGSRIVYDDVSLTEVGSLCGNCELDEGEGCDDGNQTAGDGCGGNCDTESCGDGAVQPPEVCDDGDNVFSAGDACTPACRAPDACAECALTACPLATLPGPALLDDCWSLEGVAEEGPAAGAAKSLLCEQLRSCVHETACNQIERITEGVTGKFLENCYCGSAGEGCFDSSGAANGSCQAEIEAALESTDALLLFQRMGGSDPDYPIFQTVDELLTCEGVVCATQCVVPSACGDGHIQDRNFDYVFHIGRDDIPCRDDLTHSGRGCSFEECDDGNLEAGDGCDQHCFVEACGNNVTQAGEQCDDGNKEAGDGCNASCQAEYVCGDSEVTESFEECDPPDSGPLCSLEEYEQDPTQCGCDGACAYAVCGNGVTQGPLEQCDPPDGIICGDDCRLIGGGPCEDCISALPDVGPFNEAYCNSDPLCVAVKQCLLRPVDKDDDDVPDGPCFDPTALDCYCGIGLGTGDECEEETFEPAGPCVEVIRAGQLLGATNLDIVQGFFSYDYPAGIAANIVDIARGYGCAEACGLAGM